MSHSAQYLSEVASIADYLPSDDIESLAKALARLNGRLFIIGFGGSLANAIHMAADLRKLCGIDARTLSNIAELTARANDEGLDTVFSDWMGKLNSDDAVFVLSVGGGTQGVSKAICVAIDHALDAGAKVYGIVGPHGGHTFVSGQIVIRIPAQERITPHTEAFQAVIWHCLVSHPDLQRNPTKW